MADPSDEPTLKFLDESIQELHLSVRTFNLLTKGVRDGCIVESIGTRRKLIRETEQGLLKIEKFGRKCLQEVMEALKIEGLGLGMTSAEIDAFEENRTEERLACSGNLPIYKEQLSSDPVSYYGLELGLMLIEEIGIDKISPRFSLNAAEWLRFFKDDAGHGRITDAFAQLLSKYPHALFDPKQLEAYLKTCMLMYLKRATRAKKLTVEW